VSQVWSHNNKEPVVVARVKYIRRGRDAGQLRDELGHVTSYIMEHGTVVDKLTMYDFKTLTMFSNMGLQVGEKL
jgi:hypothetical protein